MNVNVACFSALQRAENSSILGCRFCVLERLGFSALQRAENSSIRAHLRSLQMRWTCFSALQRAENSSICVRRTEHSQHSTVSVLFSEPKIPQFVLDGGRLWQALGFSALQRAENSSITRVSKPRSIKRLRFSALQRAENSSIEPAWSPAPLIVSFSALQRAENSSILRMSVIDGAVNAFQCSSASRKFLNAGDQCCTCDLRRVSVLFSEPKIPQFVRRRRPSRPRRPFQCSSASRKFLNRPKHKTDDEQRDRFSALQRAENSSIRTGWRCNPAGSGFQCSSASRKFLNLICCACWVRFCQVSVLFSEPKIPQLSGTCDAATPAPFQCSSASRKFLNGVGERRRQRKSCRFSALQRAENSSIVRR